MPKNGGSAPVQDVNHFFFSLFWLSECYSRCLKEFLQNGFKPS
jgi:hypothetical protein